MTAGVAAPAYAGIPLTHRDDASAVAFVTGHEDPEKDESEIDWDALARVPRNARPLHGREAPAGDRRAARSRPGAIPTSPPRPIERGTMPANGPLSPPSAALPDAVAEAGLGAPAISSFGPVAARRDTIAWLERRPLHGKRVVVTRARAQASGLAATLARARRRGGRAAGDPDRAADRHATRSRRRRRPSYLRARLPHEPERGPPAVRGDGGSRAATPARSPTPPSRRSAPAPRPRCASTASSPTRPGALRRRGSGRGARAVEVADRPVLVARAAEARDVLPNALRDRGAMSTSSPLYETVTEDPARRRSSRRRRPTTSPSPRPRPCATCSTRSATGSRAPLGSSRSAR